VDIGEQHSPMQHGSGDPAAQQPSIPSSTTIEASSQGQSLAQPNPENKLFVGGAPPGTDEETLKKLFAEHGEVEEVFVMRGGSRSGQCAVMYSED